MAVETGEGKIDDDPVEEWTSDDDPVEEWISDDDDPVEEWASDDDAGISDDDPVDEWISDDNPGISDDDPVEEWISDDDPVEEWTSEGILVSDDKPVAVEEAIEPSTPVPVAVAVSSFLATSESSKACKGTLCTNETRNISWAAMCSGDAKAPEDARKHTSTYAGKREILVSRIPTCVKQEKSSWSELGIARLSRTDSRRVDWLWGHVRRYLIKELVTIPTPREKAVS